MMTIILFLTRVVFRADNSEEPCRFSLISNESIFREGRFSAKSVYLFVVAWRRDSLLFYRLWTFTLRRNLRWKCFLYKFLTLCDRNKFLFPIMEPFMLAVLYINIYGAIFHFFFRAFCFRDYLRFQAHNFDL